TMSSELELLIQHITELEAENTELRKENTEIPYLRNKLSVSNAEIAELKHRNAEVLRANGEYNEMRDVEKVKLRQESRSWNLSLEIELRK
ncbi:5098_t:CDS:1, partial [Cetraspora pellucida]